MAVQSCFDDENLSVRITPDVTARLFGAPFLVVGLYFLYHLVAATWAVFTGSSAGSIGEQLIGGTLILMMTTAFGVPGLLLIFGGKRVDIDLMRRTVTEVQDYGVFKRRRTQALNHFRVVDACYSYDRSNREGRRVTLYEVHLVGPGRRSVLLANYADHERDLALDLAARLAGRLNLPTLDRTEDDRPGVIAEEKLAALSS